MFIIIFKLMSKGKPGRKTKKGVDKLEKKPNKGAGGNNNGKKLIELPPTHDQIGEIKKNSKKAKKPKPRGRKKKAQEHMIKPEEVLEYMIRNYPKLHIDKIKDSVIEGLKNRDVYAERLYVLDDIVINGDVYFCDPCGNILNDDAQICGFVIDTDSDSIDSIEDMQLETHEDNSIDTSKKSVPKSTPNSGLSHSYQKAKTQDLKHVKVQMFYAQTNDNTYKQQIDEIEKI